MRCFVIFFVLFVTFCVVDQVVGYRKCVCTSKACKETGEKICRTRYSCYTELIYVGANTQGAVKTTRGCTESETPLLCETISWRTNQEESMTTLPRLTCCNSHDYCNAADEDFEDHHPPELHQDLRGSGREPSYVHPITSTRQGTSTSRAGPGYLHFAALVLAVAALFSVFGACYVVTRFLKASTEDSRSIRTTTQYNLHQLDF